MRLISASSRGAVPLALLATAVLGSPAAQAAPPDFPNIDAFDSVTWNDYLVGGDDAQSLHLQFLTPSGLTCFLNVDAFSYECWGALHGAPAGANHVRGNVVNNQPAPELEDAPTLLPNRTKISWRGVTCGVDGKLTACYQVDHGFILDDKQTKVFPSAEPANGPPVSSSVPDVGASASPASPAPTAAPTS
ncbi:MAG: translation initiation factor 2 [Segniliparus sp.]|uniref:translation initiation factor 2 n=1 Tax=Segniliparus sp. TaxID=2804064 RepID=UPI003F345BF9